METVRRHSAVDKDHGFENAIKDCIENDILREYLQRKSREVMNMLLAEYDYDTDIAVQREESFEIGLAEGEARGKSLGLAKGKLEGKLETARLMRQRDYPPAEICLITGLSQAEVEAL